MEWINVKDEMPPPHREVLVWAKYGLEQPLMAWFWDKENTWHISTECTDNARDIDRLDGTIVGLDITHWMPLPSPPQPTPEP